MIQQLQITNYTTQKGINLAQIALSYQVFGQELGTAAVVLINHALTGNSNISGEKGWWKDLVNYNKIINLHDYTVIAFDIPNNEYAISHTFAYDTLNVYDIAKLFYAGLAQLKIQKLFACVGGSLGGCIAWELATQHPNFIQNLIVIGSDWKATDWILAQCEAQRSILQNSINPIQDARKMAMLFYRTPASFKLKFNRKKATQSQDYQVNNWLNHHGKLLEQRFSLKAYQTMNYLLSTADITQNGRYDLEQLIAPLKSNVYQIGINSDLLFTAYENKLMHKILRKNKITSKYWEIDSIHGHDSFLIEYKQLNMLLKHIFVNRFKV